MMEKIVYKKLNIRNKTNAVFLADLHFGVRNASDEWQQNQLSYFNDFFIPLLKKQINDKTVLFILGDIFDDRKAINVQVNDMTIDIFSKLAEILPVYVLSGNHDLYKKTNKGVTSLRSIEYIPGVKLIREPTQIIITGKKIIAIPYLGDIALENQCLIDNADFDYAFMHTDLAKMKYDNGMDIIRGVNTESFHGKIFSGHIHKRQAYSNMTYVGSPYQLTRADINNTKGVYFLNFENDELNFTPNNFSPIFQSIDIDTFVGMKTQDQLNYINNNYNDIVIYGDVKKYNLQEIYDLASASSAKRVFISYSKKANLDAVLVDEDTYKKLSLNELIHTTIDGLDIDDEEKKKLKLLSDNYYRACENELNAIV